jgi:hypothetical protein
MVDDVIVQFGISDLQLTAELSPELLQIFLSAAFLDNDVTV